MKKIAIFPGSFDPVTKGHENLIIRAAAIFDKVIVAIGENSNKKSSFPIELRKEWLKFVTRNINNTSVEIYNGLTVDFCKQNNAQYIIRGIRTNADFEFESDIAQMNKAMNPEIETVFLLSAPELSGIKSALVREIYKYGGDTTSFLPKGIIIPESYNNNQ